MKYIYLKGYIKKRMLIVMLVSFLFLLFCLLFLFGYTNVLNNSLYGKENKTLSIHLEEGSTFDINKYSDILENYNLIDDEIYMLEFKNTSELEKFRDKNKDTLIIVIPSAGDNEKELILYNVLKYSSYVLLFLMAIIMIVFEIHYINSSKKVIKLYYILGLPIKKIIYLFNFLINITLILASIFIYIIANIISPNILIIENFIIILIILLINFTISSILTNKLFLPKNIKN